jgi:hypothetical protein
MCIIVSIQNKHIDCFKEACKNIDANDANDIYANDICTYAILCGSVEFLKYAHENGYPLDPHALEHAIIVRNIDCLKYAHEHGAAIQRDILQSLYSRADDITNLFEIIKYMYEHVKRKNFDDDVILKYLYEQNVPFHPLDNNWIIYSDHMKCLRFAILAGAPTNHCFRALVIKTNLRLACLRIKKKRAQRIASIVLKIFNRENNPDYREIGKLVATHIINTSH